MFVENLESTMQKATPNVKKNKFAFFQFYNRLGYNIKYN